VLVVTRLQGGHARVALGCVLAAAAHLVGGCVLVSALAARRYLGVPLWVGALGAGALAVAGEPLVGLLTGAHFDQLQWRYLLPGVALFVRCAVTARRAERRPTTVAKEALAWPFS
jgi:hypothetical protein